MGWWSQYLRWRQRNVVRLTSDREGFALHTRGHSIGRAWDDVRSVTALKRDLMTVDLVCLLLNTTTGMIEVSEEMEGFARFEADLEAALDVDPTWKLAVLFPAFATNATAIFTGSAAA